MRAFMVLLAFVATPLAVGVSQKPTTLPGKSSCLNGRSAAYRSAQGLKNAHLGLCAPTDPPPPPPTQPPPPSSTCAVSAPSPTGTAAIQGAVFLDADPWPGLSGWCVQLTGSVTATTLTDASGTYWFTGLPTGTYTVCEVVPSGWQETFPTAGGSCPTGGYTFSIADGNTAFWNNFGDVQVP